MKDKVTLTIASLLSILFFTLHWTEDVVRGIAAGGLSGLSGILILVVWLYGRRALAGRRSGVHHHAAQVDPWGGSPHHPHERSRTCRRPDRQFLRSLLLGLDAHRARRDLELRPSSRCADSGACAAVSRSSPTTREESDGLNFRNRSVPAAPFWSHSPWSNWETDR